MLFPHPTLQKRQSTASFLLSLRGLTDTGENGVLQVAATVYHAE